MAQSPFSLLQQLSAPSPESPFEAQTNDPQQPVPSVQVPPAERQQLRLPSELMPLLAQIVVPPAWLHSLVAVHVAPGWSPVPELVPPQTPPTQSKPAQQSALLPPATHAPP